jgi:hypothetical protein
VNLGEAGRNTIILGEGAGDEVNVSVLSGLKPDQPFAARSRRAPSPPTPSRLGGVIGHARLDQDNNVTLYDGANRITAGRCAGRRLRAYAKTSECVGVDAPTSGTLVIAPNRP